MPTECQKYKEFNETHAREIINSDGDAGVLRAIKLHADPEWWKGKRNRSPGVAYLRRWGCVLRREARKRGLL